MKNVSFKVRYVIKQSLLNQITRTKRIHETRCFLKDFFFWRFTKLSASLLLDHPNLFYFLMWPQTEDTGVILMPTPRMDQVSEIDGLAWVVDLVRCVDCWTNSRLFWRWCLGGAYASVGLTGGGPRGGRWQPCHGPGRWGGERR